MLIHVCTIIHKEVGVVSQAIGIEGWREKIDILAEAEEKASVENADEDSDYVVDWQIHEI